MTVLATSRARNLGIALSVFLLVGPGQVIAEQSDPPEDSSGPTAVELGRVEIVGNPERVPGAASFIGPEELEKFQYADPLRVLRAIPGVYIQDEEGYGLRPNIGIRGSGLDRSSRIALLEDNVLIAPAPYAAPSAYYFPTQRRMYANEVLKGPSSITVGPRTTGGALNMVSRPVPVSREGALDALVGGDESFDIDGWYGASGAHFGWMFETVQQGTEGFQDLDGTGNQDTGFRLSDYLFKTRLTTDYSSPLYQGVEIKLGHTEQTSHASYLGLTDDDFADSPYRRYAGSQIDEFDSDHQQYQLTYFIESTENWELAVTAYRQDFHRNWYKLDSVNGAGISSILGEPDDFVTELNWIRGDDSLDDALIVRNNNRDYYSQGVQGLARGDFDIGGVRVDLSGGVRFHEDEEDRFQDDDGYRMEDGLMLLTSDGTPGSQTNRVSDARASSAYIKGDIEFGNWLLSPGLRYEDLRLTRTDYSTDDPGRLAATQVRSNDITVWIPGIGALYTVNSGWSVLGGIYKGYNPPAPGSSSAEENSVAYELGTRVSHGNLGIEAVLFHNDYSNLVGTVTASTGGGGDIGDQFDAGEVDVSGLEFSMTHAFGGGGPLSVPLRAAYTYTPIAEFKSSFDSDFSPWGDVEAGDRLPYVPVHQTQVGTGLMGSRWNLLFNLMYQGETRTMAGQGPAPAGEMIDARFVVDLAGRYTFSERISFFGRVTNLFDNEYAVARRPAGLRPGKPRMAMVGALVEF